MEYSVNKQGDTTVRIEKFMIEEKFEPQVDNKELLDSNDSNLFTIKIDGIQKKVVRLKEVNTDVKIIYHRLYEFSRLFEYNNLSMRLLEKSLSPVLNTE